MSKCVKCGNEILTGDIHWEMGLCNNCYNELYKDHKTHISLDKMWLKLAQDFRDENEKLQDKVADLEAKLAEKEKEIKQLKYFKVTIGTMENNQVDISSTTYIDQDKISFAIEQLEKVKKFTEKEIKECNKLLQEEFEDDYYIQSVNARQSMCYEFKREIDNQIKQLKEKNNG